MQFSYLNLRAEHRMEICQAIVFLVTVLSVEKDLFSLFSVHCFIFEQAKQRL